MLMHCLRECLDPSRSHLEARKNQNKTVPYFAGGIYATAIELAPIARPMCACRRHHEFHFDSDRGVSKSVRKPPCSTYTKGNLRCTRSLSLVSSGACIIQIDIVWHRGIQTLSKLWDNPLHRGMQFSRSIITDVHAHVRKRPKVADSKSLTDYHKLYQQSLSAPHKFWGDHAHQLLQWDHPFSTVSSGGFAHGDMNWFSGGRLNACVNCVDRHAFAHPDKVAVYFEPDDPAQQQRRHLTYGALLREVCKAAQVLRSLGVRKGDVVTIYMPVVAEALVAMLACARIGALHSVVFAGFSAAALRGRILDAQSTVVIAADEGRRAGNVVPLKRIVDEALTAVDEPTPVKHVLVFEHTGAQVPMQPGRDRSWAEEMVQRSGYCPAESLEAEDGLFLLYTSGSTGKPKGLVHTIGGFLLGAAMNGTYTFDLQPSDSFFCAGDIGWITGHTYGVYMPLLAGIATVLYEGTPVYPDASRYWTIVKALGVTHLYTAPTSLRLLKRAGDTFVTREQPFDSLRVVGCVGEPIAPEVWKWTHSVVGKGDVQILDVSIWILGFEHTNAI